MITKLKLNNWRSHLNSELEFSDGTNCFIGDMGTGKTSIMSGICFALFGTFPELQSKKLKLEDIIMKKPKKQSNASVELEFAVNDDIFNVKRFVEKGHSTAELRKNGEMIESPQPSKVNVEIERALKINYDLFTRAIYSEQNQLDMFLTIPKGQRMKKIDELLAIDRFEKARSTTKLLVNKCYSAASEKRNVAANLENDSSLHKIDIFKSEINKLLDSINDMKKQFVAVKDKKEAAKMNIENLKQQQLQLNTIEERIKMNLTLISMSERDIETIKDELAKHAEDTTEQLKIALSKIITEMSEIEYNLGKERENISIMVESNAKNEAKLNLLTKLRIPQLRKLTDEKEEAQKKIKAYESKDVEDSYKKNKKIIEEMNMKLQQNIAKISELEEGLKNLENVSSSCPICDSELPPHKKNSLKTRKIKQLHDIKDEIKDLKVEVKKTELNLEKLEESVRDLNNLKEKVKYIGNTDRELREAENELEKLEDSMKIYLKQKKMEEKNIEVFQKSSDAKRIEQDKIRQLIFRRNEVDIKMEKIKQLKVVLEKLNAEKVLLSGFSPALLVRSENEYSSMVALERELDVKIKSQLMIISEKEMVIKELESKKKLLEGLKDEINRTEVISEQLKLLESALVNTQEELRKNFVKNVNTAMQAIWEDVYPYKDFYGVRLGIENGDYVLQLQDSTGWLPADGIASGGERSIACLALRIAFSLILAPQLKWIVLDEPTHNLDARAVDELGNVLREKVTNIVDQIFLITHDPSLESAVSGYLYKLEREKLKDGYTVVNRISGPI